MPPRRSTRSASAQLPPVSKPAPNKRKRGQPSPEEIVKEEETVKPLSRARKPPVGVPGSRTRASSRSAKPLEDVQESDEEDSPPVKKSRPSLGSEESDEERNVKPPKARRAPARKPPPSTASSSSRKGPIVKVEVLVDPPMRSRRSSRAPSSQPPSRSSKRVVNGASGKKSIPDIGEEEEEEEEEEAESADGEPVQKPSRRVKAAPRAAVKHDDDDLPPSRSSRRGSSTRKPSLPSGSQSTSSRTMAQIVETASEGEEPDTPPSAGPSRKSRAPTLQSAEELSEAEEVEQPTSRIAEPTQPAEEEEEEEEHSLLDIIRPLSPQPQTQASITEELEGPKPRLVIHKMALVNFKSYAGRQEIGPFHKSFSAIVGPNGSGKSNTIDALLFVFGYRASKMRQAKLSELIHNSARHPDLEDCSVEVHFREIVDLPGPNNFEVVPDSQLIVTRTAFKNNTSRYSINSRQSNYKEVQALLKGRGIDLDHNRFLILQGEVESIAQMKPKAPSEHEDGLLEYLEDIIGTSQYKEPIEEALTEMDRLNEDRVEKLNRLKIVERERNALEKEKKEAEDYLRLHNDHVRALSKLWQWYLWKCLQNEEAYAKKIAKTEQELKDERERNQDDITHLEMLEEHYKERGRVYEEVKAAAAEAVKDLTTHEKQQVSLEERRKHTHTKVKKLKKSLQDDEHARAEALRSVNDNATKIEREKAKAEELEESLAREEKVLENIRDSLKDKTQVYHDQIEVKQRELQPWTAKINSKQAEIDVATSERDTLAKKAAGIKEACKEAQTNLEQLREDHQSKVARLEELQAERSTKMQESKVGQRRLRETQESVQELRAKASSSRQKADEAKASQAASTTQNKVLEGLTRLKNTGRIDGFHGRLGSLGTIPDKYDVAVSTACGTLNNMVVDKVEQGQACIAHLRKQNLGRASFLVLSKLRTDGMDRIQTPENVPRLFDLIKPKEPRFAPAFFKGVNNTLVAENLEQANRIAFGGQRRWRVVTLAGQLIDSSGTMSGGGNHVARGGMSSKLAAEAVSPEVLRKYEQDSEQAAHELDEALQRSRQMEIEVDNLATSGPRIDIAIEKVNLDIQTGAKRIADMEKRVRELKAQSKPDAGDVARIASLEEDIEASTEELNELQGRTASIEVDIKALEKKILEIGGARLLSQKSKVDGICLNINIANDEITKAEVAKAKGEKDSSKLEQTIKANTANLEEVQGELEELNESLEKCSQYVEEIRSTVEAAQIAAENSKEDLETLKAELDQKTEEIQVFKEKEMELKQILSDAKKEAADNGKLLDHWQREHDKLRLEDVDEDDEDEEAPEEGEGSNPNPVKPEPGEPSLKKKSTQSSLELPMYTEEELAKLKKSNLTANAEYLDEQLKNAKPNLAVLKDYRKREEEFLRRAHDLEEVTKSRDAQKRKYEDLTKQRLDEFMAGFSTISSKLKEMYQTITLGGNAELELVDSMDPFAEGIVFSVMPPKKSWRNISNLSGGEKTLSSLALVFALHVYKPTPLYFMDEIDAALDFRNVSIVANYIKDRTKNAQFIIISLRNDMFELSHRLIGIYKTANATRSISIDNDALHSAPLSTARA